MGVLRTWCAGKLHGLTVTRREPDYHGSVGISRTLLDRAGLHGFEAVTVVNMGNGARWDTYAMPLDEEGEFHLNGGGALLGALGDRCIVFALVQAEHFPGAIAVQLGGHNTVLDSFRYPAAPVPVRMPRLLELGNYVAPAYAGMLLVEQGWHVTKWMHPLHRDPVQQLVRGAQLWAWLTENKQLVSQEVTPAALEDALRRERFDAVLDNFLPDARVRHCGDLDALTSRFGIPWVSLQSEDGRPCFDVLAQRRAWGDVPWVPFYIGDTAAGLALAFKVLALVQQGRTGHHRLGHATVLAKLREGELVVDRPDGSGEHGAAQSPWDLDRYGMTAENAGVVEYGSQTYVEPARDDAWRRAHLWHDGGRYRL